jgi:hypothetical protein
VALAGVRVEDVHVEHLDDRELLVGAVGELQLHRHDVELDAIPLAVRVVGREVVQATVDHRQRGAQVLLTTLPAGEVGEVRRDTRSLGGCVVLVETGGGDAERDVVRHGDANPGSGETGRVSKKSVPSSCGARGGIG